MSNPAHRQHYSKESYRALERERDEWKAAAGIHLETIANRQSKVEAMRAVLRKIPIARMRQDYTGLECIGCGAGPEIACREDCWAMAIEDVLHEEK